ncbi:hypothetical protein ACOMHN_061969 [Nucella lapillus]
MNIQYQTDTLENVETVTFTDRISATPSPLNNSISVWPGMVELHITVLDNNTASGHPDGVMANLTASFSREVLSTDPLRPIDPSEFSSLDFVNDPNMYV